MEIFLTWWVNSVKFKTNDNKRKCFNNHTHTHFVWWPFVLKTEQYSRFECQFKNTIWKTIYIFHMVEIKQWWNANAISKSESCSSVLINTTKTNEHIHIKLPHKWIRCHINTRQSYSVPVLLFIYTHIIQGCWSFQSHFSFFKFLCEWNNSQTTKMFIFDLIMKTEIGNFPIRNKKKWKLSNSLGFVVSVTYSFKLHIP